jgi:hypothetical protein
MRRNSDNIFIVLSKVCELHARKCCSHITTLWNFNVVLISILKEQIHVKYVLCLQVSDYVKFKDLICKRIEGLETDYIKVFK